MHLCDSRQGFRFRMVSMPVPAVRALTLFCIILLPSHAASDGFELPPAPALLGVRAGESLPFYSITSDTGFEAELRDTLCQLANLDCEAVTLLTVPERLTALTDVRLLMSLCFAVRGAALPWLHSTPGNQHVTVRWRCVALQGTVDFVVSMFSVTPEREEIIDFVSRLKLSFRVEVCVRGIMSVLLLTLSLCK